MIRLIVNYFKVNKRYNFYIIIILFMMFMIFRTYVDEVIQDKRILDYAKYVSGDMYILDLDGIEDEPEFEQEYGDEIANVYQDILNDDRLNEPFACYHVNEFYNNNAIYIKKGRLLSYNNENEVLVFGKLLRTKYNIGDKVILGGREYSVVGYLDDHGYLVNLFENKINNKVNIEDLSTKALNGGMFIANDFDYYNSKSSKGVIKNSITLVNKESGKFGNIISFEEVKKNTINSIGERKRFKILGIIMLLILLIYSVCALSVMQTRKCGKMLAVYYLQGISKTAYILFGILTNVAIIACANLVYIFIYLTGFLEKIFFQSNTMGMWCVYSSLILSFVLIVGTTICNLFFIKDSALEIMRKCE